MPETILVGYDDSAASRAALQAARDLAADRGAVVRVLTTYHYAPRSLSARQGADPENERRAEEAEDLAADACATLTGVAASARTEAGRLAEAATRVAHEEGAAALVLGRSPELVDHLGRESRRLECPLIVVPALPHTRTDAVWREAIDAARRAPSSHNTQPWTFRRTARAVELLADPSRALDVIDPDFRELTISCGAALHHLRVALAARGYAPVVETLPDDADEPIVARVRLGRRARPGPDLVRMSDAIARRHTDRGEYPAEWLPAEPFDHLRTFAADEGARLTLLGDQQRRRALAALVEQADRAQAVRPAAARELLAWMRLPGRHHDDGLPLRNAIERPGHRARREADLVEAGPVLGLISTPSDEPGDWLAAGQALSAVVLGATARGLSSSFFDAPIEETSLRSRVAEIAEVDGVPQLLLRFGHGQAPVPSPRRSLDDVVG